MSKYRIERIQEEGKADLFQPQIYMNIGSPQLQAAYSTVLGDDINWQRLSKWEKEIRIEPHESNNSQTWETQEKAMDVINLHKAQSTPKITKTYINVE